MNERIKDHRRAMAYFDDVMDGLRREAEDAVAADFKEARRLQPEGVDEADLQLAIFKAVRAWLPRPTTRGGTTMDGWTYERRNYEDHDRGVFFELRAGARVVGTVGSEEDARRIVAAINGAPK